MSKILRQKLLGGPSPPAKYWGDHVPRPLLIDAYACIATCARQLLRLSTIAIKHTIIISLVAVHSCRLPVVLTSIVTNVALAEYFFEYCIFLLLHKRYFADKAGNWKTRNTDRRTDNRYTVTVKTTEAARVITRFIELPGSHASSPRMLFISI